jgi:hypothetical protein
MAGLSKRCRKLQRVLCEHEGAAMGQADLMMEMPAIESERVLPSSLAVLIEVPAIQTRSISRPSRPTRRGARFTGRQTPHGRRRLRPRVRLAGCAMMALVPIVSACTIGWSSRPDRILPCSIMVPFPGIEPEYQTGQPAVTSSGVAVLSVEPFVTVPDTAVEAQAPVVFPGYVLSDDTREGSLHEGS